MLPDPDPAKLYMEPWMVVYDTPYAEVVERPMDLGSSPMPIMQKRR